MSHPGVVRVIAICVFRHNNRILLLEGFDNVKRDYYYRPLGGAVEFGEPAHKAIVREIREEIRQEITDLRLVGVIENLFTCDGVEGHEIVFVFEAGFVDESVYSRDKFQGNEEQTIFTAVWRRLDSFDGHHRLVPEHLIDILNNQGKRIIYCPAVKYNE